MTPYQQRRHQLMQQLPAHSMVLVSSGRATLRNRDVDYPFRAHSDFLYLTGFEEADATLVLIKHKEVTSCLFLPPKDPDKETWEGRRLGVDMAPQTLQVDEAFATEELAAVLETRLEGVEAFYVSFDALMDWMPMIDDWISHQKSQSRKGVTPTSRINDLDPILHEMRLIKSEEEIQQLRKAAEITVAGHLAALKSARPGQYEYQLQAVLESTFKHQGSPRVAFNSIVASGENACILHYTENTDVIEHDQLILIDAGAEYQGYAGDITQTFPANGRFTEAQRELYQLVLDAQHAAIAAIGPGKPYQVMHEAATRVLTKGLVGLGFLTGDLDTLVKEEAFKPFFMHGTGHWLGLDVHDVGAYKCQGEWRNLNPGMVVTVEPGLYISQEVGEAHGIPSQYWDIGIRIEDDVLVTDTGYDILTQGLPRTIEEIEQAMAQTL